MYPDSHNEVNNPDDGDYQEHKSKNDTDIIISLIGFAIGFCCIYAGFLFTLFSNANSGDPIYEYGAPLMVIGGIIIVVTLLKKTSSKAS